MRIWFMAATLAALMAFGHAHAADEPAYDLVIRNGRMLDGQGNPWVHADVAIQDDKFVKIGRVEGRGRREIDTRDDYVSPGWIDMMDQSGQVLLKNGLAGSAWVLLWMRGGTDDSGWSFALTRFSFGK